MQDTKNPHNLREIIDNSAFGAVGVARYEVLYDDRKRLVEWLSLGMHGEMGYMERSVDIRHDLRFVFPDVQSVIVTLTPIHRVKPHKPTIAAFAHNFRDYHVEVKNRLHTLLKTLQVVDPDLRGRAVVDSATVLEKAWAVRAGLGWIGRNSLLVNPSLGSCTIIGLLLVNKEIETDAVIMKNGCPKGCTLCRDTCPNGAINDNLTIDSRRCISYMTLESSIRKGSTHGHILGCDRCTDICPYNKDNIAIDPTINVDWMSMTEEEFRSVFRKSSFERVGLEKIRTIISAAQREGQ